MIYLSIGRGFVLLVKMDNLHKNDRFAHKRNAKTVNKVYLLGQEASGGVEITGKKSGKPLEIKGL